MLPSRSLLPRQWVSFDTGHTCAYFSYVTKVWNCSVTHLANGAQISREQVLCVCVCVCVCVCGVCVCVHAICTRTHTQNRRAYWRTHTHTKHMHTHTHTKQACILAQGLLSAQVFAHLGSAAGMSGMPVLSRSLFLPDRSFLPLHWVSFDTGHTCVCTSGLRRRLHR